MASMASERSDRAFPGVAEQSTRSMEACDVAVGVLNSCSLMMVAAGGAGVTNEAGFTYPQRRATPGKESVLEAACQAVREVFSLEVGEHVAPVAIMESGDSCAVRWVLFVCCDSIGDEEAIMMAKPGASVPQLSWQPLDELIASAPPNRKGPLEAFEAWALPLMDARHLTAVQTDLTGLWARVASRNQGVEAALQARGLDAKRATAEASRPYVQRWRRCPEAASRHDWQVITFDSKSAAAPPPQHLPGGARTAEGKRKRTVVYTIGDWTESYRGESVLFGSTGTDPAPTGTGVTGPASCDASEALLVRRTSWLPQLEARPRMTRSVSEEESLVAGLLPASYVAHTTWTSRTDQTAEIVSRFLRGEELVVRRVLVRTPLRAYAEEPRVVCEEVFMRAPQELCMDDDKDAD